MDRARRVTRLSRKLPPLSRREQRADSAGWAFVEVPPLPWRSMAVVVRLAGRVGIEADGVVVGGEIGGLGRLALAYLVWERHRPVGRTELAELLWGEQLPRSWGQLLRGIVSKLRATLAAAGLDPAVTLTTASGVYQLSLPAGAVVDVEEAAAAVGAAATAQPQRAFELASAAVAVASGQFLPAASGVWVERRQAELRELHLRALEALAAAAEAGGQWAAAVAAAEEAVSIEAFRESAYLPLMAAHAGAGNRGEALRAYERCRRTLADELGVGPSPATEAAYLALLGDEPAIRPILNEPAGPEPLPLPPALAASPGSFLVGREAELTRLAGALQRAVAGQRQAVLVSGEPGIGKTALVSALARQAHAQGARVLYGHCDEDLGVVYQPFGEALGGLVAAGPRDLAAYVGAFTAELLRLAPELARHLPDVAPSPATDPESDRFAIFEAVAALLAAASQAGPVVLVVDDLHWATNATLLLLRHLVRSATPAALLVVGTYRQTEVGADHPLTAILADLRREQSVERIALGGLDEDAVAAYVDVATEPSEDGTQSGFARAIHAHTAGNPFFVGELLRHLAETGAVYRKDGPWSYYADAEGLGVPEGVREVVARRRQRLSEAANRSLAWAAVIGAQFDLDLLEAVVDPGDGDGLLDSIEEAVGARLVVEIGLGRYAFAHALVRDSIYSEHSATRRARLHRRVGEALERLPGDTAPRLAALAHHFIRAASAAEAVRAADYALAAARQALTQAAWEDAITVLGRGLEALELQEPPELERRCDLLLALTESWQMLWDPGRVAAASLQAAEAARALGSPERLARAVSWYFGSVRADAEIDTALGEEALAALGDDSPSLRALVLAQLVFRRAGRDSIDVASREALALARRSGDPEALGVALSVRCSAASASGAAEEHLVLAEELVSAAPPGDWNGWRMGHVQRAVARLRLGDRVGFDADTDAVERLGSERRFWGIRFNAQIWRGTQALLDGRFADVEALVAQLPVAAASRIPVSDVAAIQMFKLRFEQGQFDACLIDLARAVADTPNNSALVAMLALTHAELGAHDDARREFDRLVENGIAGIPLGLRTVTLAYLAEVAASLADCGRAAIAYEGLVPYSGQVVAAGAVAHCPGAVDRYLGQSIATLGHHGQAETYYCAALALEAGLNSPPLLARTRYWFARMLLAGDGPRRRERAAELLVMSATTAEQLGMTALARRARESLAQA